MDHGIELPEDSTHVSATNAVGTFGYEDRYRDRTKGAEIRPPEDLFSLGIGQFVWKCINHAVLRNTCILVVSFFILGIQNMVLRRCWKNFYIMPFTYYSYSHIAQPLHYMAASRIPSVRVYTLRP